MGEQGYFQFPLCLLALSEDYKERLESIVSHCLCEQARRENPKFPKARRIASLDKAAEFLHVNIGRHQDTMDRGKEAASFVDQWECRNGKDPLVRIATTLFWEAHDNTGLTYREFSILCAINSIIGSRPTPMRITEPRIRVRAAGFKSWKIAQSELPTKEAREAKLLTVDQVRYTLSKLHQRRFLARARVGARTVKYMVGVTNDQLRGALQQTETYEARFQAERAKKDSELRTAIRTAKRRPINVGIAVPTRPRPSNDIIPDMITDINICSLNNGSFNSSSQNISRKNITPLSGESGSVSLLKKEKPKKLDRSQFNDKELAFIDHYHRICLPAGLGFLPVTERSEELDKVLDVFASDFDEAEWINNFRDAIEHRREIFRTNPHKYNTLVQICWKLNY